MQKSKFSLAREKDRYAEIVKTVDYKTLAGWAIDCARRVLPFFEKQYPADRRPRLALETLEDWVKTGVFKMAVIRRASLDSHAAAREVGEDNAARAAARSAGQAAATAHVPVHAVGGAIYAYRRFIALPTFPMPKQPQQKKAIGKTDI